MCGQCGCDSASIEFPQSLDRVTCEHETSTAHKLISLQENILAKNTRYATRNRALFSHLLAINILSSPGAGKTTLIQQLLKDGGWLFRKSQQFLKLPSEGSARSPVTHTAKSTTRRIRAGVIVGDLATQRDSERLRDLGIASEQITTGTLCHLEAHSVANAAHQLELPHLDLLIIENVGNLVCPAAYDLGEDLRVVLMSVTEGEDKPLKYPIMFKSAQAVVISKIDLAAAVEFDREEALRHIHQIAPQALIFELSAKTGQGMSNLSDYLHQAIADCKQNLQRADFPSSYQENL